MLSVMFSICFAVAGLVPGSSTLVVSQTKCVDADSFIPGLHCAAAEMSFTQYEQETIRYCNHLPCKQMLLFPLF